jgi:hypothetical protein
MSRASRRKPSERLADAAAKVADTVHDGIVAAQSVSGLLVLGIVLAAAIAGVFLWVAQTH